MKTIKIKTTESKKEEVIKRYSVLPTTKNMPVWVEVVIDDENSEVFKKLSSDPDVKDWDFKKDMGTKVIEVNPESLDSVRKVSEINLMLDMETVKPEDLSSRIDVKDMNEVIWWCIDVYMKELIEHPEVSPERSLNTCIMRKGPVHLASSKTWDGLSEGIIKMILVLMGHGPKEFSKILMDGLLKAGHYFLEESKRDLTEYTKEEVLHKIFVD